MMETFMMAGLGFVQVASGCIGHSFFSVWLHKRSRDKCSYEMYECGLRQYHWTHCPIMQCSIEMVLVCPNVPKSACLSRKAHFTPLSHLFYTYKTSCVAAPGQAIVLHKRILLKPQPAAFTFLHHFFVCFFIWTQHMMNHVCISYFCWHFRPNNPSSSPFSRISFFQITPDAKEAPSKWPHARCKLFAHWSDPFTDRLVGHETDFILGRWWG